ncbi:MAG: tetratricopeptide repeat protein [Candidatus Odinarchaeota archaeon]
MREISAKEFVRRLKEETSHQDCRFAWFLGAGCSVSSGIPSAGSIVRNRWLPMLKKFRTGDPSGLDEWVGDMYENYTDENAARYYGKVIEDLFLNDAERQREIDYLTRKKDPAFGYAIFSKLISHEECGSHLDLVLTTNFDDLVADALYLYTHQKPLVIVHESLAKFARVVRNKPLIVKLHGDAQLAPKNTEIETEELSAEIQETITKLLQETGLVFIGYGGHDKSIITMLNKLPSDTLRWGVWWVGRRVPTGEMGEWLEKNNAIWVNRRDFDELMLLMKDEFGLEHPEEKRFRQLMENYHKTYEELKKRVEKEVDPVKKKELHEALEKADEEITSWWKVIVEARKYEEIEPEKANSIYQQGMKKFPQIAPVLDSYANFLKKIRKNHDEAEKYYLKALEIEPENANNLGNYANFLTDVRKNHDEAEKYYLKALEIEPEHANNLGNYANFLTDVRKNHDEAEKYYLKALEIEPENANKLGNYAIFLKNIRKNHDEAEKYYLKALEIEPDDANKLGNYADFLTDVRKNHDEAEKYYLKALEIEPDDADTLGNYAIFLKNIRKNHDEAEKCYLKVLEIEPEHANNLGNYAGFLLARGSYKKGIQMIEQAFESPAFTDAPPGLASELFFYQYAHERDEQKQEEALIKLKNVLLSGVLSPGWNLIDNVNRAKKDGHPHPEFLEMLAKVISEEVSIDELEKFDEWTRIKNC